MDRSMSRRRALAACAQTGVLAAAGLAVARPQPAGAASSALPPAEPWPGFPRQNMDLAREVVAASHGNEARVRELVDEHPALARATWDWGFGDWETALGAASHTGRRGIALYLIEKGARIDLFAAAMLGYVEVVRALVTASPGIQRTRGPHGIHLLAHATAGGPAAAAVVEYLRSIEGAAEALPTQPLTPDEQRRYVGEFVFGESPADRLVVTQDKDTLWIERPGMGRRGLSHVGDHAFFPAGALAVRVCFTMENGAAKELRVVDGSMVVVGRRAS